MQITPVTNNYNISYRHAQRRTEHDYCASFKRREKVTADDSDLTLGTFIKTAIASFSLVFLSIYGFKKLSKIYSQIAGR